MKAQYVGDIGDFGKVLLLKHLAALGFNIGVNWVLTENDGLADGEQRDYVDCRGADCLCCCDSRLIEGIAPLSQKRMPERRIADLKDLIRSFSEEAKFYAKVYPAGAPKSLRGALDDEAFSKLQPSQMVFFDPDNGLGVGEGSSVKHVYLADIERYWARGQSLLVYHHLSRSGMHNDQVEVLKQQLKRHFSTAQVKAYHFRRGSARVYLLCLQPEHSVCVPEPEQVGSLAPLLMSKGAWAKLQRIAGISCSENHPWYKANRAAPPPLPSRPARDRR
jgi:hypothetical protein